MNDLVSEARSLFHRAPSARAWRDLCALLDRADLTGADGQALLDYCAGHLSRWPDPLREAPTHWALRALMGDRLPQLALARAATLPLEHAEVADVDAFCAAPEAEHLRAISIRNTRASHRALHALTHSTLGRRLDHFGTKLHTGTLQSAGEPLHDLAHAPPEEWTRRGVLEINSNVIDPTTALVGPHAQAVGAITSYATHRVCRALGASDQPLRVRTLSFLGLGPLSAEDAAHVTHARLPELTSLDVPLSDGGPGDDPLATLDAGGVWSRVHTLKLRGAATRDAATLARAPLRSLKLEAPRVARAGALLTTLPATLTHLTLARGDFQGGLEHAALPSLEEFTSDSPALTPGDYASLAQAPLRSFSLRGRHHGVGMRGALNDLPAGARALVDAPMPHLRAFSMWNMGPGEVTLGEVTSARWFSGLEHLSLSSVSPDPDHVARRAALVAALAEAEAPALHALVLSYNELGDDALAAISALGAPLRRLLLANNALRDLSHLGPRALTLLRELNLAGNPIAPHTLAELTRSGALTELETLDLSRVALEPGDLALIFHGASLPRLRDLSIRGCALSLEDAIALESSVLPRLDTLDATGAGFGDGALAYLTRSPACAGLLSLTLDVRALMHTPRDHALHPMAARAAGLPT